LALSAGGRIGSYEIVSAIGAGGMGEVYRARDTKLARDVALKVLPSEFALDPDRLARFTREAQVLASLNHQNIAAIYGFEENALVLEFVDGPTLADRIAQGPLSIDDALPIARQIAEALEAAHEQGIIHRDLKPANIKVRPNGTVKVLDFGLAKLVEGSGAGGASRAGGADGAGGADWAGWVGAGKEIGVTQSPTITTPAMTMAGVILGTAAYMSPEQAKGKPADTRSDIWAFGVVLFEMLTGRRAFQGDDVSDTLAAVLRGDADWSALPADTPLRIRTLLQRCLRRDAQKRLPHIAMARCEIDETAADQPVAVTTAPIVRPSLARRSWPVVIAVVLAAAMTSGVWWMFRPAPVSPLVARFTIPFADEVQATYPSRNVAISNDGSQIVYVANGRLNLRSLSESAATVIANSERGAISTPAFSPDGQSLVYEWLTARGTGPTLKTISTRGGTPTTVAQLKVGTVLGLSWSADGIVYSDLEAGVVRVSPAGGQAETLVQPASGEVFQGPSLLPGGRAVLFAVGTNRQIGTNTTLDTWDQAKIVVRTLPAGERRTLIEGGSDPRYLPTGHLLFVRSGTLFGVPFDVNRLEVKGRPIPVVDGVARVISGRASNGLTQLGISATGSLVYATGPASASSAQPRLAVIDRTGKLEELKLPAGFYERPRVSPDGSQLALGSEESGGTHIWIHDLSGKSSIRQLTFDGKNRFPIWSHDGTRVAFQSDRDGDLAIFWQRSDGSGTAERVTKPEKGTSHIPESWSSDGKHLLYTVSETATNALWVYSLETRKSAPFADVRSPRLISPTFSPDGRWIAYTVLSGVGNQVFMQPFPATGAKYLVGSGQRPQWSPDGKEIFFLRTEGTFVKTVTTQPRVSLSTEAALPFSVYLGRGFGFGRDADIMPDGKRWVAVVASTEPSAGPTGIREFQVVLNWFEELKQKFPR
jgi:Tol biopolymer transport system component/predicted Ser/Thr protein kinase